MAVIKMTALLCPLCSQPHFNNLESLRLSLVNAATQSISCPVCGEVLVGLDKLTIHLFGHTLGQSSDGLQRSTTLESDKQPHPPEIEPTSKTPPSNPIIDLDDLSFLTPLENPTKTENNGSELSDYMSELLEKKLPVLDFPFPDAPVEEKPPEFQCSICDFTFQNAMILSMHKELAHSSADKDTSEEQREVSDFVLPRYSCHLCPKSFKMKGSLLVHYKVAHLGAENEESTVGNQTEEKNFRCSICTKSFKKEQHLTQHIKTHEGKRWQCETCFKHFTTKYFLKKHRRLHTGEMPYSCETCNKTFTFQQSYHKHLLYHSDEKPHRCIQCGRSFKELSTLHNHQRIHSGEKPFACETCGKCFRQRVSYIVHQRIHTGVLPYQCTACKKKFRYKVSQRSHKCPAQPPGVVVRQPSDLIQRILDQRTQ